jgi:hypothetical protein
VRLEEYKEYEEISFHSKAAEAAKVRGLRSGLDSDRTTIFVALAALLLKSSVPFCGLAVKFTSCARPA